jgi:hypothetical protein
MSVRCKKNQFTVIVLCLVLLYIPNNVFTQFEQKLSVNISAGYFNTVGTYGFTDEWSSGPDDLEPTLMPNFEGGPSVFAGLQYNFSRHFSVEFQFGFSFSFNWYFDDSGGSDEPFNYLYYEVIGDSTEWEVLASGDNYMDLTNFHFGLAPRYYFSPGKKINPFIFAGINFNITDVYFDDQATIAHEKFGLLDEYELQGGTGDVANWFDYQSGIGIIGGAGIEYALNDYLGLFLTATYHYIPLKEEAFIYGIKHADFHAINIHFGGRFSFLKSKDL